MNKQTKKIFYGSGIFILVILLWGNVLQTIPIVASLFFGSDVDIYFLTGQFTGIVIGYVLLIWGISALWKRYIK